MIETILNYWANPWIALFLYWLPMSICAVGYTLRTFENYHKDLLARDKYIAALSDAMNIDDNGMAKRGVSYYHPTDRIGTLIGRALIVFVPLANVWAAVFDVSPRLFSRVVEKIEKIFDQPLVPSPDRN